MSVFKPEVMSQRIGYLNSNEASIRWRKRDIERRALCSFADPDVSFAMHDEENKLMGVDWTFGGWLEDRSDIWADTYLKKEKLFLHLGVDSYVPAGTEVFAVLDGKIVYAGNDTDIGGWGRHVIQMVLYCDQVHALIYGHLHKNLECKKGDIRKGQPIGWVGDKHHNGQWAPHLHLQLWGCNVVDVTDWKKFLEKYDGYGKLADRNLWANICPDPTPLIFT